MPPSTSIWESARVAPVRADRAYSSSRCSRRYSPRALSSTARWWKVSSRSAGPPTRRPYSSAEAMSTPVEEIRAISSPVTASFNGAPSSGATCQEPET